MGARQDTRVGDVERTARFLVEHTRFVPRDDDVFVATYPRSGTTWLQYAVYLLTHPEALDDVDADDAPPFAHINVVAPWYERSFSRGHRRAADFAALEGPRVFKTHLLPGHLLPGHRLPRGAKTHASSTRVVYAWRDVGDVAVSYWNLYRSHLSDTRSLEAFVDAMIAGRVQYGSWHAHVDAWKRAAAQNPRIHVVRYEALHRDPLYTLRTLAAALGLDVDDDVVARVAAVTRFVAMKKHQARFDHATDPFRAQEPGLEAASPSSFIRTGNVGGSRRALPGFLAERLRKARAPRFSPGALNLPAFLL